jgi:hypothetical protein
MDDTVSLPDKGVTSPAKAAVLWSMALYLIWTFVTYLLEGRINLLQQPTVVGRFSYVLIANVLIGTIGAFWVLQFRLSSEVARLSQLGFQSIQRTLLSILAAVLIGVAYLLVIRPATLTPLIVLNGFAQVLTVSIAEVIVCWAAVGTSLEWLAQSKGKSAAVIIGFGVATILFSLYHLGHSAPFNQVNMMLFLLVPGVLTSLFYVISREIYATIIFHNFQGMVGVIGNLANPDIFNRPLYPLYLLMLISVLILVGADLLFARRAGTEV